METRNVLEYMKHTPWNWYYVCDWKYMTPDISPEEHQESFQKYGARYEKLDEIGSSICSLLMPFWWMGIDEYDFTELDIFMEALLKEHPNRTFVPRIKLEPPLDWQRKYPEELCVYWNGPSDAEEIRRMVGTPQHDCAGHGGGSHPFPDERIARQSFSSRQWVKDASEALSALVQHIENGPYGRQVIGYMPAFGNCGECMWWGDWRSQGDPRKGDFGITHTKLFYEWCLKKYGSLEEIRRAWNLPGLTRENFREASPPERWSFRSEGAYSDFWERCQGGLPPLKNLDEVILANDQRQVDTNAFHSEVTMDALEAFGKVIKEICGKPVGSFYGYLQDYTAGYAGHLAIDRALSSPYLDFFSSPKGYHYCQAGDPGSSQAPAQSFARKKLWIEENDLRSHHRNEWSLKHLGRSDSYAPKTEAETVTCFWRELYRALTFGFGFWWMDINGLRDDWFGDPMMVDMFKRQSEFYQKWSPVPRRSIAQVMRVEDEESYGHMTYLMGQQLGCRLRLEREMRLCGVPVDRYRLADLEEMDLSQYRFIMFSHAFVMPEEKWRKLRARMRPDVHILWNYAVGLLNPAYSPENQKAVTGFCTAPSPGRMQHPDVYRHIYWHSTRPVPQDYPLVELLPQEGLQIFQTSPDGHILTARVQQGMGASIFAADITLRTPLLRKLMQDAGVSFLAPENCTVLADEKLLGFFPRFDMCFSHSFDGTWRNVLTGKEVSGKHDMQIRGKDFEIYEKIDG